MWVRVPPRVLVRTKQKGNELPNQYTRLTTDNVLRKMNRRRDPVTNVVELAREFGENTVYSRSDGSFGSAAPGSFREKVKALVGETTYNRLRDDRFVNTRWRLT